MFLSLGPKVLKDAEKCWERAPEVNPSPPVISFHHMQLQRESKIWHAIPSGTPVWLLANVPRPLRLQASQSSAANVRQHCACFCLSIETGSSTLQAAKLPSITINPQSTHIRHIYPKNPFLGRGMAPHLSHLVSACRHTLGWAPSFRLPVDSVHFAENMCAVVKTWWGVWSSIPKRNPKMGIFTFTL